MNPQDLKRAILKKRNPEGWLLERMDELEKEFEQKMAEMMKKGNEQQKEIDTLTKQVQEDSKKINQDEIIKSVIAQIPVPEDGDDGDSPDPDEIAEIVMGKIRIPEDGDTPVIDLDDLAQKAASLIPPIELPDIDLPEETGETIAEKLGVDLSFLKNLKKTIDTINKNMRSNLGSNKMIHGGGHTIKAGAGQTLTRNSDGTVTLTITTSGLTPLNATETPNGVIKIFTFSGASAQPSYLIVDNVWMKATSAAGGTNWTWNSGAKQATLTVPAADDIWAVV